MSKFKPFHFTIGYDHEEYECDLIPAASPLNNDIPSAYELFINKTSIGIISYLSGKWKCDILGNQRLVDAIGDDIEKHYKSLSNSNSAE
ncbi:MAG TPA: hypothetical protein VH396_04585 [Chitinophagaceae bacterium]